ncbi:MAG: hypothetical protein AAGC70_09060, partial [Pseudomonadota bacterium]
VASSGPDHKVRNTGKRRGKDSNVIQEEQPERRLQRKWAKQTNAIRVTSDATTQTVNADRRFKC